MNSNALLQRDDGGMKCLLMTWQGGSSEQATDMRSAQPRGSSGSASHRDLDRALRRQEAFRLPGIRTEPACDEAGGSGFVPVSLVGIIACSRRDLDSPQ